MNCIALNQFYTDKFYSVCSERLTKLGKDMDFVAYAKSRTPTYLNIFNILLFSHLHANGWIDITVFRNSQNFKENRSGAKYISETIRMKLGGSFLMEATKSSGLRTQNIMLQFDPKKALQLRRPSTLLVFTSKVCFHVTPFLNGIQPECSPDLMVFIS